MRFWMTGSFASALSGFIWLGSWQLVLSMTAILTTGVALPLQPGPAAIAGLLTALFGIAQRPAAPLIRRISGMILLLILFLKINY